jgi:SAM-dependent methyltransferase
MPASMTSLPKRRAAFPGSERYWEERYARGGTSGAGSSGALAQFKANVLNDFVARRAVMSVIEFGCGDGRQLALARYPSYTGIDVSPTAIGLCKARYGGRPECEFYLASEHAARSGGYDLALSLDVIFHLVEEAVYESYMRDLFSAAERFVIIYASNEESSRPAPHVRHRRFTGWIVQHAPEWDLTQHIPNPYPYDPLKPNETSFSDFYVFARNRRE